MINLVKASHFELVMDDVLESRKDPDDGLVM